MVFYELVQNFQFKRSYNKNKFFQIRGSAPVFLTSNNNNETKLRKQHQQIAGRKRHFLKNLFSCHKEELDQKKNNHVKLMGSQFITKERHLEFENINCVDMESSEHLWRANLDKKDGC